MIITLFSNTSWSLYNFRKEFILKLLNDKNQVQIISNRDETSKELVKMGCKFIPLKFDTLSKNPLKEILYLIKIFFLISKIHSDIYINFTIKPCVYFGIVNLYFKKKSISLFDGLGRSFIEESFFGKLIKFILKVSQKSIHKIILVNKDDIDFFLSQKILKSKNKIFHLKAPGLNVDNFNFKVRKIKKNKVLTFSFISRIMEEKGIIYFLKAAEYIKLNFRSQFVVIGKIQCRKLKDIIDFYKKKKVIKYFPNQKNIKPKIIASDCIVLPSYYGEGLPRILQEANFFGRICITTNNVGCKDVILNNYNGFICKKQSLKDLTNKIKKVILMDKKKMSNMEKKAHFFIKKNFDKNTINNQFVKLIYEIKKI